MKKNGGTILGVIGGLCMIVAMYFMIKGIGTIKFLSLVDGMIMIGASILSGIIGINTLIISVKLIENEEYERAEEDYFYDDYLEADYYEDDYFEEDEYEEEPLIIQKSVYLHDLSLKREERGA